MQHSATGDHLPRRLAGHRALVHLEQLLETQQEDIGGLVDDAALLEIATHHREQHAGHVVQRMIEEDGVAQINPRKPARQATVWRNVQNVNRTSGNYPRPNRWE